jgi:aminoglycoside phosphotransferase (APT) family kinase protein
MLRVATDPLLSRVLAAAGLDDAGSFTASPGWVNRVWVSDDLVIRFSDGQLRGGFLHEALVVGLLTETAVPHARCIGTGTSPDGTWYICERLPGRTLHQVWNELTPTDRREVVTALGAAIRVLHQVEVPIDLKPPWLSDALTFEPRSADDARIEALLWLAELAALLPGADVELIKSAQSWMSERLGLFVGDARVLVHADLHPSNVMVDGTKISGLIDFELARAQPADAELHRLLFWCARPQDVPPLPGEAGLDVLSLRDVPGWLRDAYPQPFAVPNLRERLLVYEMQWELAQLHRMRTPDAMSAAQDRIRTLLSGHGPTDELHW